MTSIINGKRVSGSPNEIREVQNAFNAYDMIETLNPLSIEDLLKAHHYMMDGLIKGNGEFRCSGICITNGNQIIQHIAPPAELVPGLIADLFQWYRESSLHVLIKSAIFHYEFEFIHPFSDGNGRIGRMRHSMLLGAWRELFYWLPIEDLIRQRQKEYYDALGTSDREGNSTEFIKLMLEIIRDSIRELELPLRTETNSDISDSIQRLLNALGHETLGSSGILMGLER